MGKVAELPKSERDALLSSFKRSIEKTEAEKALKDHEERLFELNDTRQPPPPNEVRCLYVSYV